MLGRLTVRMPYPLSAMDIYMFTTSHDSLRGDICWPDFRDVWGD